MTDLNLAETLAFATDLAAEAAERIRNTRPAQVTSKTNPADLCTEVDVAIERWVRDRVGEHYPEHAVDGEELGGPSRAATHTWYLDPIDGTTNFVSGLPWSSFSLALADADGPLLAVVADPYRGEVAAATRGGGGTLNGRPVRVTDATAVAGTVVLTEWSGHLPWADMDVTLGRIASAYGTVRIMGSSALALTSVALGRAAGAIIGSYHPVDDLAGVLLAQESGALVVERNGGVLVAAPGVLDELAACWA